MGADLSLYQSKGQVAFAAKISRNIEDSFAEEEISPLALESCSHLAKIARIYRMLETHLVYATV